MEPIPYKSGGFPGTSSPLAFEYLELLVLNIFTVKQ